MRTKILALTVVALTVMAGAYAAYACCYFSTPPDITGTSVSGDLWPPNHKMRTIALDVQGTNLAGWAITGAWSSEADNGTGDGDTAGDVGAIAADGHSISLRAERAGGSSGRTYTIQIMAWSPSGGIAYTYPVAVAPHDMGK